MNTALRGAGNPTGVFVPAHWPGLRCGAAPANHPNLSRPGAGRHSAEVPEKVLAPGGTRTPNCAGACLGPARGGDAAWTQ